MDNLHWDKYVQKSSCKCLDMLGHKVNVRTCLLLITVSLHTVRKAVVFGPTFHFSFFFSLFIAANMVPEHTSTSIGCIFHNILTPYNTPIPKNSIKQLYSLLFLSTLQSSMHISVCLVVVIDGVNTTVCVFPFNSGTESDKKIVTGLGTVILFGCVLYSW